MSRIDDNLDLIEGAVICRHCGTTVGNTADTYAFGLTVETPSQSAGPSVRANAKEFTVRPILLRRILCPTCLAQLQAEIVPGDEPSYRHRKAEVFTS